MSHTFHRYKIGDEPVAGYRLMSHLGAGGFGEVWKATAPGGTEVALKIIDLTGQQGVQEFTSLRVVKKVRHPNLISLQAFWMKDEEGQIIDEQGEAAPSNLQETAFLPNAKQAMEAAKSNIAMTTRFARPVELIIAMQLGSMSLHRRLEECREQGQAGVPVAELLEYLEQAARGIDFLNKPIHDLGNGPVPIVHGDVKPHNILVVGDAAVVCDFGLARAVETLRKTSMAPVTVAYAAPESFKGKVTPTSDQYSLAITYAELRTGRLPFDETMTPYQVMEAHVTRNLDFSRLPDPEKQVVMRATDGIPEDRWPTSRDLILALRHAVAQTGELPLRPGEVAYTGGPTPSHSLTARPELRGTGLPTRHPVDPSRDTMHPGGHTPSEMFSQRTSPSPLGMEPALGEEGRVVAPGRKKSLVPMIGAVVLGCGVLAGIVVVPKLLNNNQNAPTAGGDTQPSNGNLAVSGSKQPSTGGVQNSAGSGSGTLGKNPDSGVKGQETASNNPDTTANVTEPVKEAPPPDENTQYIQAVQKDINGGDFNTAIDLLDKAPSKLPGYEKENLQKRLKTAFLAYIDSLAGGQKYVQALAELDDTLAGIGLAPEDKQKEYEKIRGLWLTKAQEALQNGQPTRALETAHSLLRRFDGDRDALFVVTRCQIQQGDYAGGLAGLNKIGKTTELPIEYQPLHAALLVLATGLQAAAPADWMKALDDMLAYLALEKGAAPPAALALNSWERSRLDSLRTQIIDNVRPTLNTLPADQATALVTKLEQLGSSAELQMFKIKTAVEAKNYDDARKMLQAVSEKLPADSDLKPEVTGTELLITLRDPASKPPDAAKALGQCGALLGQLTPSLRGGLCEAAEALALAPQSNLLEAAIELTTKARDLDPGDKGTLDRLARLLTARLMQRAAQPNPPSAQELPKLLQDFDQIDTAGMAANGTLDAFHAECLLAQSSPDRQELSALMDHAKPVDNYTQFVQARVLRLASQPDWTQIAKLLIGAYGDGTSSAGLVAPQFRRALAAKMLIEAGMTKRVPISNNPATVLSNPFGDPAVAAEVFRWLHVARVISEDLEKLDLKQNKRELWVNWSLAAQWKPKASEQLLLGKIAQLAKLSNTDLGVDAFPILYVAYRTLNNTQAEQLEGVQAAQQIAELFQKQFGVADPQAVTIYTEVLQPALGVADGLAAGKSPPAELDKFYAAAAEFVKHYQRATKWPFTDRQAEIEKLVSTAIKLNPKVAKYYTERGVARISLTPPNVDGALEDATEAVKLDANLPAAYALQGYALIYRSRREPSADARTADLEKALAQCKAAVEKSKADDKDRSMHFLYLSMAQLERANFDTDSAVKKDLLSQAVANAQQAVDLEKAYPDYAYTALGNALEDLAWIVGEEPEKNYRAAIDAFTQAINNNPSSALPLVSRARCYYKAIADSKLDPKALGGGTLEENMQAAIADLQQAKLLNPNAVEPDWWLGKVDQVLGKYDDADAALGSSVKLAEEQKLPERSMFIVDWTRNAILNKALSDADRTKAVRERADELKQAPSLGGSSTTKQAVLLVGESLLAEKPPKLNDAIKEYDAALTDYDKADPTKPLDPSKVDGADVSLLLARAACRYSLPNSDWNMTTAEGVIKDDNRVIQLKPGPRTEAMADWYSANVKFRSAQSSSPTFTAAKKLEYRKGALEDVRKAITLAPDAPDSWRWRTFAARALGIEIQLAAAKNDVTPDTLKKWAAEARGWINQAIDQAGKRPDLADQMSNLQRAQQDLEKTLTDKKL
ncbi:MAG TPA: serine/threonine-protein kinase [Pirellulales bacterium]|nr:serine/threonine-protein kinase [Pirellulales bacterium]